MKLSDVTKVLDDVAPLRFAEKWDNVGLLVGDPEAEVKRILVTVDYTRGVADEGDCDLVVAYHPPMFAAVKRVPHQALWAEAVRKGIALYSPHTALDVAHGGTNDFLGDACAMTSRTALRRFALEEDPALGLGRVGDVAPTTLRDLVAQLKPALGLGHVLVAGDLAHPVKRVAVAAGAGGELLNDALRAHADVFLTGEIRHHDALSAVAKGTAVIATMHSNSERAAVRAYAKTLAERMPELAVRFSEADADPFVFV